MTEAVAGHLGTMFWDWDHDGYAVSCSCGYTTAAHGSRSDAQRKHDVHVRHHLRNKDRPEPMPRCGTWLAVAGIAATGIGWIIWATTRR